MVGRTEGTWAESHSLEGAGGTTQWSAIGDGVDGEGGGNKRVSRRGSRNGKTGRSKRGTCFAD